MDITGSRWNIIFRLLGEYQLKALREKLTIDKKVPAMKRGQAVKSFLIYDQLAAGLISPEVGGRFEAVNDERLKIKLKSKSSMPQQKRPSASRHVAKLLK